MSGERVAVITDIHGNLAALEAVLAAIDAAGVETIYCGGDLVGYGPYPNQVCDLIQARRIPTIFGNYDYAIGRDLEDCGCEYVTPHDRAIGQLSVDWTLAHTNRASKDYLRGLPFDERFDLGGRRVRLVHGSPRKVNEYLFQEKPARTFERIAGSQTLTCSCSGTPTNPGSTPSQMCSSSTAAQSGNRRTAIPAPRTPSLRPPVTG